MRTILGIPRYNVYNRYVILSLFFTKKKISFIKSNLNYNQHLKNENK